MNDAIVNFKTNSALKRRAQRKAEDLGISLSTFLNAMLRKFIRVQDIDFTEEEIGLEPTEWLKKELRQAEQEIKRGDVISFQNWEEEKAYLDKLIETTKRREQKN